MHPTDVLTDVRIWIIAALLLGLLFGFGNEYSPQIVIVALVVLMVVSLQGMEFSKHDIIEDRKAVLACLLCCFVISPAVTLAVGYFFDDSLWTGWVMLAAVPSAIAVVSSTEILRGDSRLSVISTAVIYVVAIALTPLLTFAFAGSAVSPWEILKYVVLCVAIPMIVSIPLKRFRIPATAKSLSVNFCFFLMIFISFGMNRQYIFSDPKLIALLILAACVRLVCVHLVLESILRKMGVDTGRRVVYVMFAIWKNSGLAVALCLLLLPGAAQVAIPAAISMPLEMIYFMFLIQFYGRLAPASAENRII